MIISLIQEKYLTKLNTHSWLNTLRKTGIEEIFLNLIKGIYIKATANIILTGERLTALTASPLRWRTRQGFSLLPTLLTIVVKVPASAIRQEKDIKVIQIAKETIKLFLLADDMIVIENPKEFKNKVVLELISELANSKNIE